MTAKAAWAVAISRSPWNSRADVAHEPAGALGVHP